MSEGLPRERALTVPEKFVLAELLARAQPSLALPVSLEELRVQEMADGGMGSLYFVHPQKEIQSRRFGKRVSEVRFHDVDDVPVLASLNVDSDGDLFELDVWKSDFSAVRDLNRVRFTDRNAG